jgi:hypothetical protein
MTDLSPKEAERRPERREIRDVVFERHRCSSFKQLQDRGP